MPGPCNAKKKKRQHDKKEKQKLKQALVSENDKQDASIEHPDARELSVFIEKLDVEAKEEVQAGIQDDNGLEAAKQMSSKPELASQLPLRHQELSSPNRNECERITDSSHPIPSGLENPFISDPGNGPRVKDTSAFLASFFCPQPSLEDETCASFARAGVLDVLEAVLPKEIALIVWFNKTRKYRRICPACQRLYRLGDALLDPISGEPVDVYNPQTPPQVLREQQVSGICSSACFLLASYSSHPYVAEVARGAWGLLTHELSPQIRALLDTTDPATAALMRFGIDAWEISQDLDRTQAEIMDDLGLGRVMRMTRSPDMGLGDVLKALKWAEEESADGGRNVTEGKRREVRSMNMHTSAINSLVGIHA